VSEPTHPRLVGGNSAFDAFGLAVDRDRVFVASEDGLTILNAFTNLRFQPVAVQHNGRIRLFLHGGSGQRVQVQRSFNLVDWQDWQSLPRNEAAARSLEDSMAAEHVFYRAIDKNRISSPSDTTSSGKPGSATAIALSATENRH
jgi:hypothetical protein